MGKPRVIVLYVSACAVLLLVSGVATVYAQDQAITGEGEAPRPDAAPDVGGDAAAGGVAPLDELSPLDAALGHRLPRGFGNLTLGIELEELKERLQQDPSFQYRGDPEVSLVPRERQHLVETRGGPFVEHAVFQFHEDRLFTITLNLNRARLDYYAMYTRLRSRYGEPDRLDPARMIWEDEAVRVSLERPLTVKYLDLPVFEQRRRDAGLQDSVRRQLRDEFLELF